MEILDPNIFRRKRKNIIEAKTDLIAHFFVILTQRCILTAPTNTHINLTILHCHCLLSGTGIRTLCFTITSLVLTLRPGMDQYAFQFPLGRGTMHNRGNNDSYKMQFFLFYECYTPQLQPHVFQSNAKLYF